MDTISFSIKIRDKHRNPIPNVEVTVYDDANIGGSSDSGYTASDGWVFLSFYCIAGSFPGKVFVNGDQVGRQSFSDGSTGSYTI
ncbi:MAG: hypothetical protein ACI9IP_000685 [Arcticibacterium sp.]|jgi:hypothetical protein